MTPKKIIYNHSEIQEALEYHLNRVVLKDMITIKSIKITSDSVEVTLGENENENNED